MEQTSYNLANTVRPDISFTVGLMSRFMKIIEPQHLNATKHVLRYLKKTRTMGITYMKSRKKQTIFGYTDSDFAGEKKDRKSTSGHLFILLGGASTWSCKKQSIVANSSQEAESVAFIAAIGEAVWLRCLMQSGMKLGKHEPTLIYAYITGANGPEENESIPEVSKHIDDKYHSNMEKAMDDTVFIRYTRTDDNVGVLLITKLGNNKYKELVEGMGLHQGLKVHWDVRDV